MHFFKCCKNLICILQFVTMIQGRSLITENLEIGVSTKLIVTARIRGNVLLESTSLHIYKQLGKKILKKKL